LNLALDRDEWLTYYSATVPLGKVPAVPMQQEAGWVPELVLSYWEVNIFPCWEYNPRSSSS